MQRIPVGLRIHGNGAYTQLFTSPDNTQGNLSAIGYQYFGKHISSRDSTLYCPSRLMQQYLMRVYYKSSTINRGWPNSTGSALSTRIYKTLPLTSDLISFINFIASIMQITCPGSIFWLTCANDGASGLG